MKDLTLLVVDESQGGLVRLQEAIQACLPACEVLGTTSADEALAMLAGRSFDLTVIDGHLIDLCRRIKSQPGICHTPVLLVVPEHAPPSSRAEMVAAGADDLIASPIDAGARGEGQGVRGEGADADADDMIARPIDPVELNARLRVLLRLQQAERRLRETHAVAERMEQLAHVSRLSVMGEMATAIAHELNQPLCAIATSAQACSRLLKSGRDDHPAVLEAISGITSQAKRAGEIIHHLQEFTRRRPVHRSTIQLADVLNDAARLIAADASVRGVRVRLSLPLETPPVLGDTIQIEQVLVNLMRNGIESIDQEDPADRELDIHLSLQQTGTVEVAVRDTGRGLPDNGMERLFEPFYSTKPEGMGIGLCVSRSIIEAHGGRLWASPAPDRGAIFHFTLPTSTGGTGGV